MINVTYPYLRTQKSLPGCGAIEFLVYWNTSVVLSSFSSELHLTRSSSHTCRSSLTRSSTISGGASTSVEHFHSRRGCPSATFLYDTSTSVAMETDTQPLNLSRDSLSSPCMAFSTYVWWPVSSSSDLLLNSSMDTGVALFYVGESTLAHHSIGNLKYKQHSSEFSTICKSYFPLYGYTCFLI